VGEPFISEQLPIRLRPLPTLRVTALIGGTLITVCGIIGVWGGLLVGPVHNGPVLVVISAPFALYGAFVTPVSLRLGLDLYADRAVVRGYLGTRVVPRSAIVDVTPWPSIIWVDPDGRQRRSVVNALNVYRNPFWARPNPALVACVDAQIANLKNWVADR
jgi:hypothetical protein